MYFSLFVLPPVHLYISELVFKKLKVYKIILLTLNVKFNSVYL